MGKPWKLRPTHAMFVAVVFLTSILGASGGVAAAAQAPSCPVTVISIGGPGFTTVGGSLIETGYITAGSSTTGQPAVPAQVVLSGTSPEASVPSFSSTTFTLHFVVHPGETVNFSEDLGPAPQTPGNYEAQAKVTFEGVCKTLFTSFDIGVVVTI